MGTVLNRFRSTPAYASGMGALPQERGVSFRVWAPHATAVHVVGTFNDWKKKTATPLAHEGNGYWYGDVAGRKSATSTATA